MHSLATERVRMAYRIAYSLLDKVAFLVDHYWKLEKIPDRINFKNVGWSKGRREFSIALRKIRTGLSVAYSGFPKRYSTINSSKLLRLMLASCMTSATHLSISFSKSTRGWAWLMTLAKPSSAGLGLSINSDLLEAKALRVMRIARSALIQVALAIGVEERSRSRLQSGQARRLHASLWARRPP
jgi:hypothetical protein